MKRLLILTAILALFFPAIAGAEGLTPSNSIMSGTSWYVLTLNTPSLTSSSLGNQLGPSGLTLYGTAPGSGNTKFSIDGAGNVNLEGKIGMGVKIPSSELLMEIKHSSPYIGFNTTGSFSGFRMKVNGVDRHVITGNSSGAFLVGRFNASGVYQNDPIISYYDGTLGLGGIQTSGTVGSNSALVATTNRQIGVGCNPHSGVSMDVQGMGSFTGGVSVQGGVSVFNGKQITGTSIYGEGATANVDLNIPVNIVYLNASAIGGTSIYFINDETRAGYAYSTKLALVQNVQGTGGVGWCDPLTDMSASAGITPAPTVIPSRADWYTVENFGIGASLFVTRFATGWSAP